MKAKPLRLRPPDTITAERLRRVIPHDCALPGIGGVAVEVKELPPRRPIPPVAVGAPAPGNKGRGKK